MSEAPEFRAARLAFTVAAAFWAVSAALGLLLRLQSTWPVPGLVYGHLLHTHSHLAFLGWVYNAFFALSLRCFIPPAELKSYTRLFLATQVAVVGMLATYPWQGYAAGSITFSTLHMILAGVLAWKLLRRSRAAAPARPFLAAAFGCMLLSGLGPLTLGPLAALGLRESPWYTFSIYFYLHFQYNGWFMFFLLAVVVHRLSEQGTLPWVATQRLWAWLLPGTVLSLGLSALWMHPPPWVTLATVAGGIALVVASVPLWQVARAGAALFPGGAARGLAVIALGCVVAKHALQAVGPLPVAAALLQHRWIIIGFLHLVFLGVVSPLLLAWAIEAGWLRVTRWLHWGLGLIGSGFVVTQAALFHPAASVVLGWTGGAGLTWSLLGGSLLLLFGILLLLPGLRRASP